MLDRFGATYVIDWGLAHARGVDPSDEVALEAAAEPLNLVASDETIGDEGGRVGTVAYMSPEQLDGPRHALDERSDVWGLGAMLYQVLTGRAPRDRTEAAWKLPPRPVLELEPQVPTDLAALCNKAMADRREQRYPSAEALAADLDAWLHGRQVSAHAYRPVELLRRFVKANRVAVLVAGAFATALLALGVVSYLRVRTERNQSRAFAHLILDEVLEQVSSSYDRAVITGLSAEVMTWLEQQDPDEAGAVAWAWFLLARDADRVGLAPQDLLRSCLRGAGAAQSPSAVAARLGCRAIELAPWLDDPDPSRLAALEALWNEALPAVEPNHPRVLLARRFLTMRLSMLANASANTSAELAYTERQLEFSRQHLAVTKDRSAALASLAAALERRALVASNLNQAADALRYGEEAIATARQALAARPTSEGLATLAEALAQHVTLLRHHEADVARRERLREQLGREAQSLFEVLKVLWPDSNSIAYTHGMLLMDRGDAAGAWEAVRNIRVGGSDTSAWGVYAWAALTSGHRAALVARRQTIEASLDFDALVALGLALALDGDLEGGARALDRAGKVPLASSWPSVTMQRFAAETPAPLGPGIARFVDTFDSSYVTFNDDQLILRALTALAAEWRVRAATLQGP